MISANHTQHKLLYALILLRVVERKKKKRELKDLKRKLEVVVMIINFTQDNEILQQKDGTQRRMI